MGLLSTLGLKSAAPLLQPLVTLGASALGVRSSKKRAQE